jgi:hypothetical protein
VGRQNKSDRCSSRWPCSSESDTKHSSEQFKNTLVKELKSAKRFSKNELQIQNNFSFIINNKKRFKPSGVVNNSNNFKRTQINQNKNISINELQIQNNFSFIIKNSKETKAQL